MTKMFDYQHVYGYINQLIKDEMKEHQKIPSENELAQQFNIARATVRQGITKLKNEGLIYSKKGSGNFVSPKKITYSISSQTTFSEEIQKAGKTPLLKTLETQTILPDEEIAGQLSIPSNSALLYVKNIRFVEEVPFLFAEYYMNASKLEGIESALYGAQSISELYKKEYGLMPIRRHSTITIIPADDEIKEVLGLQHDLPLINISTITIDQLTGESIDYCRSYFRSDLAEIVVDYNEGDHHD
jgi:DNA-binding GntR family transcriptional regulator